MDNLILAVVLAGLFLGVVLGIVLYTLRQWLLMKQRIKQSLSHSTNKIHHNSVVADFEIPISYRAIKAQTPFFSNGYIPTATEDDSNGQEVDSKTRRTSLLPTKMPSLSEKMPHLSDSRRASYNSQHEMDILGLDIHHNYSSRGGTPSPRELSRTPSPIHSSVHYRSSPNLMQFKVDPDDVEHQDRLSLYSKRSSQGLSDDEYLAKVANQFHMTRRRISQAALEQIVKERRRSSFGVQASFDDDMFIEDSTGTTQPVKEEEAVEWYDEPIVGAGKRRLAKRRSQNSVKRTYKKVGKVAFTTKYTERDSNLEVHLIRAYDLVPKRQDADVNPFCRLYLVPGKQQKLNTRFLKGTRKPVFDERMTFNNISRRDLEKFRLKMKVYNHERMKKNELIGEVDVALSSIDPDAKETFDVPLFHQRSESSLAELKIALCHQATINKLQVVIMSAKRLPKIGVSGTPNTCVSVTFFSDHGTIKQKTETVRNTKEPQFNTSFDFGVYTNAQFPLTTNTLVVTVHHLSIFGQEEILGHVIFSHQSPQRNAKMHWDKVQNSPHVQHEESHFLLDPDELSEYIK